MARNVLETRPVISEEMLGDVMKEVANIIAGNCVNEMALDGDVSTDIRVEGKDSGTPDLGAGPDAQYFDVEGEVLKVDVLER